MSNLKYRKIQPSDNKSMAQVIRDVLCEYGVDKPGTVYTDPTTDELFETFCFENAEYWVVENDNALVGGVGIYPTKGLEKDCAELVKLYLLNSSRGKGVGKKLIELAFSRAKDIGYKRIYLESLPELNEAIGLYENVGFEKLEKPLGDSGHFACNIWMIKEF